MIRKVSDEINYNYPFNDSNFFYNHYQINELVNKYQPKTVCELGAMLGGSTRFWAERVDYVLSVDHWDWKKFEGLKQSIDDPPQDPTWPIFYELFISNCYHSKLENKISTLRMMTEEAAEYCKNNGLHFDVVYLDAEHKTESVRRDIDSWYGLGDILCGDDWQWVEEPFNVKRAVEEQAEKYGHKISASGNFWMFLPKK